MNNLGKERDKVNLIGKSFGRWTVISFDEDRLRKENRSYWVCECSCENKTIKSVSVSSLKRGISLSCGCITKEKSRARFFKHGESGTRLYGIYTKMLRRCYEEKDASYNNYGVRGISVCDKWRESFLDFKEWALLNGYDKDLTLDRIDVNGNYEPNNCRWTNAIVQANNKTDNKIININGVKKTMSEWCRHYDLHPNLIYSRLNRGLTGEELIKKPKYKKMKPIDIFVNDEFYKTFYTYQSIYDEFEINKNDVLLAIKRKGNINNIKFVRNNN